MNTTPRATGAAPDERRDALVQWLERQSTALGLQVTSLEPASDDASFRRYFRIEAARGTLIAMDAPPAKEDCRPFVHAAQVLGRAGFHVPELIVTDVQQGFLLLEDFGSTTYGQALDAQSAPALYRDALHALIRVQAASEPTAFAPYDREILLREMRLYPEWYLARHKACPPTDSDRALLEAAFDRIAAACLSQARVYVHRDYHCRNLMVLPGDGNPGVLDFQDALHGPVTYDLVSLLRDAYVSWDEEQQIDWAVRYWEAARRSGIALPDDFGQFYRDFEWMGLQRHLKVLGIFARLHHRDGKARYLGDLPRVLGYVLGVTGRYQELAPLHRFIEAVEQRHPLSVGA